MGMCSSLWGFLLVYHVAATSVQWWTARDDVMGTYLMMNRYQCERLCWYRKLCKTYSHTTTYSQAIDVNCVLHAEGFATPKNSTLPIDWIEKNVFWNETLQDNGCRSRSCGDDQVCVPTFASPFFTCMPFPAECRAHNRTDGSYNNLTLVQGQTTNFTCGRSLVWVPRQALRTVTCLVTGKYSDLNGTCKNATYSAPNMPFNAPLPDVIEAGWEACVKGNFTTTGPGVTRMDFNFHDSSDRSCDNGGNGRIYLQLKYAELYDERHGVYWTSRDSCSQWGSVKSVGDLALVPHKHFYISLTVNVNNTMEIIQNNSTTLRLDLNAEKINLSSVTHLEINNDGILSYVNLARGCRSSE